MPIRFNASHVYVQPEGAEGPAIAPGAGHEFTDDQIAAGLGVEWVEQDPRAGLAVEKEFKARRDRKESDPGASAAPVTEETPAESGETKEEQPV